MYVYLCAERALRVISGGNKVDGLPRDLSYVSKGDGEQYQGENIYGKAVFVMNISGLMCSFELASFVAQDIISLLPWIAAGSSRKSI